MKHELVAAADLPRYLVEVGGLPTPHTAPPGWCWVAVPDLPDAILALADHFTIEFIDDNDWLTI